jgi:CRP/FNR family transcriptional regulator
MKRAPAASRDCAACELRDKSVVCDLEGAELDTFRSIRQSLRYDAGQAVFYEGHPCLGLYLLCSGRVKLTRTSSSGQRQIVGILDGGALIEKHALQDGALHEVTCETLGPAHLCFIPREAYLGLLHRNSALAIRLIELLSSELGIRMDQRDLFAFRTGRQRLAGLLLELGARFGRKSGRGTQIGIHLKREEMADMAGVAVETAIRLLGAFRKEGLIGVERRAITLLNQERLARIARI